MIMTRLFIAAALLARVAAAAEFTAFTGARIIDGSGKPPMENATMVIDGQKIVSVGSKVKIPAGAKTIDATGQTIIPGLINAHGHVGLVVNGVNKADGYTRENVSAQLLQYEQYGVLSVLTLGLNRDLVYGLRDESHQGTLPGAMLFTAGRGIGEPDGAPPVPSLPDQVYRPKTSGEAVADVKETVSHHADYLKIWVDDVYGKFSKLPPDIYNAAIQEAHKHHLRVASHVFYLADAKQLLKDGLDTLAHSVRDAPVDDEFIQAAKSKGTYYVATLNVDESFFALADDPTLLDDPFMKNALSADVIAKFKGDEWRKKILGDANLAKNRAAHETAKANLKTLSDAGVHIAFGTDSGANPQRIAGWAEHRELELMVKAGLTPLQALTASSSGSAAMIGLKDRGTLSKGMRADFIVLSANPLDDIKNTRKMTAIWHGGKDVMKH
jgi:imidazolonepropionase-like amidohydrolase